MREQEVEVGSNVGTRRPLKDFTVMKMKSFFFLILTNLRWHDNGLVLIMSNALWK